MSNLNLQIQYLDHSGFSVETASYQLVFDYYRGAIVLGDKPVYVFSSHSHPDHYNPVILEWQKEKQNIRYIFSKDIEVSHLNNNITMISPYEETQLNDLNIKTFGSTDLGVSFLVECEGVRIFHAGDLNWWYWWGDTEEGIAQATADFKAEIAKIQGEQIDLAFFPVDPRLEHNYGLGAEYFIQEIKPSFLIPMHFWDNQEAISKFAGEMLERPTKVIALTRPGQVINL